MFDACDDLFIIKINKLLYYTDNSIKGNVFVIYLKIKGQN